MKNLERLSIVKTTFPKGRASKNTGDKSILKTDTSITKEAMQENRETNFIFIFSLQKSEKIPPAISIKIPVKNNPISLCRYHVSCTESIIAPRKILIKIKTGNKKSHYINILI